MLTSGKNLGGQFTARDGQAFALSQFAFVAGEFAAVRLRRSRKLPNNPQPGGQFIWR